jgi:hypothetical protein
MCLSGDILKTFRPHTIGQRLRPENISIGR